MGLEAVSLLRYPLLHFAGLGEVLASVWLAECNAIEPQLLRQATHGGAALLLESSVLRTRIRRHAFYL
jgi:hypothetical protein